jgi:hypothetical protein
MTPCLTSNLMSVTSWSTNDRMVTFVEFVEVLRARDRNKQTVGNYAAHLSPYRHGVRCQADSPGLPAIGTRGTPGLRPSKEGKARQRRKQRRRRRLWQK